METSILIVEASESISDVVIQAMNREHRKLYDYIVVTKGGKYFGAISIRMFLTELTKHRENHIAALNKQHEDLLAANEKEKKLRENLEIISAAEKNLLDNAGQGFMSFGIDLKIRNSYSAECKKIFGKEISILLFTDLMTNYFDSEKIETCKKIIKSYFDNETELKDNAYLMLLPSECVINNKIIRFEYKRIHSANEKMVMVILTDITDKKRMENHIQKERSNQRLLIKAATYQEQIKQLLDEFKEFLEHGYKQLMSDSNFTNELFRIVHTYKGDFSQYGFADTASHLHATEDELSKLVSGNQSNALQDINNLFNHICYEDFTKNDLKIISDTFGDNFFPTSNTIQISKDRFQDIVHEIELFCKPNEKTTIVGLMNSLKHKNLKKYLIQFNDYLYYLSDRLQKTRPTYNLESVDIYVDIEPYKGILKTMGHLFRNMLDHGIEPEEERVMLGKSEQGNINCNMELDHKKIIISLKEDGQGIDLEKIKQKAVSSKLYSQSAIDAMNEEEIIEIIFLDHFSTKAGANILSGRGVGMAAIKYECEKLGGHIHVFSQKNKGTEYIIELPYLK
jgi:two-component system chemotaxis sensor kinase CheA